MYNEIQVKEVPGIKNSVQTELSGSADQGYCLRNMLCKVWC